MAQRTDWDATLYDEKHSFVSQYGLEVVEQLPLEIPPNDVNRRYLHAKKYKMGHDLKEV